MRKLKVSWTSNYLTINSREPQDVGVGGDHMICASMSAFFAWGSTLPFTLSESPPTKVDPLLLAKCPYRPQQQCAARCLRSPDFLLEYFESGGGGNGSEENNPDIDEDFIALRDQESLIYIKTASR